MQTTDNEIDWASTRDKPHVNCTLYSSRSYVGGTYVPSILTIKNEYVLLHLLCCNAIVL